MTLPPTNSLGWEILSPGDQVLLDPAWPQWDEVVSDVDGVVTLRAIWPNGDGPEAITTWPATNIKWGIREGRIQWRKAGLVDLAAERSKRLLDLPEMGPEYDGAGPPQSR